MTTANKPKNQNPDGLPDLGQIDMKPAVFTAEKKIGEGWKCGRGEEFRVNYYGTSKNGYDQQNPDDDAQVSIYNKGWSVCLYLTVPELRRLAGDLTRAARDIEEAQEAFDSFQRFNRKS